MSFVRNDYKCGHCGSITEFFGKPDKSCEWCLEKDWHVVFSESINVCFNNASVLEKLDEVNGKIRKDAMLEMEDPRVSDW